MRAVPPRLTFERGFTLAEMAMVLFIIALLMGSLMLPLSAQDDVRKSQETATTLSAVQDALVGFAAATGRLPCPAIGGNGQESYCDDPNPASVCNPTTNSQVLGRCSNPNDGLVPAAALGLSPTDAEGRLLDGWGTPIRYAVSDLIDSTTFGANTRFVFTGQNGMKLRELGNIAPDLRVCAAAPTAEALALRQCANPETSNVLTSTAVAVIYSLGPNGAVGGAGTDESHNPNPNTAVAADRVFISHERAVDTSANGEFDDIVVWLSPNILYNRMIAAGRLP